jgi:hypothetical protein
MRNKPLTFSGIFISINDALIDINKFKEKLTQPVYKNTSQGVYYTFEIEFTEDFLKIYFTHGRPYPHPEEVINTDTLIPEENPRSITQYEPKQDFAFIDFRTGILWINNSKKKAILIEFLKEELAEKKIVIKDVYNEDDFIEAIKRIDEIRFSAVPDLFSETSTLTKEMANEINGYGANVGTIHLKYDNTLISDLLKGKIKSLFSNKANLRGIMISGRDSKNLGMLFNAEIFSRKIQFNAPVDEDEIFDKDTVYSILIGKVKNEDF